MKVLIITLEYPPQVGGIASYVTEFASKLPAADTIVLAPEINGGSELDKQNPWKTIRAKLLYTFFWPRWLKLYFLVKNIVKTEGVEKIVVNQVLPVGYVAYLIKKSWNIPYEVYFHGTDVAMAALKKNKLNLVCARADRLVVNSNYLRERLAKLVQNPDKIKVVYPAVDKIFFDLVDQHELVKLKSELGLSGKKIMLSVARLVPGKGFLELARLLPELLYREPNLVWVVVGDGPLESELRKEIEKNSLSGAVRFLGQISHAELPKIYQLADIFVLLTHAEGASEEAWGEVFLEASASGLPIVAGQTGGVSEAVENNVTGLLVDVKDTNKTLDAIVKVLKDKTLALSLGEAGKTRAKNL